MGKNIPQIDDPAAIPTAVGLLDMSSSVLDSSSRATSHASRSSQATTVLSKDIKKQKAVYKKRIRQLHSVLVELKDSRITSEKMLRNIRQEVALLRTQQHTSEQMELIEARNKILVLEKENAALRRILVQQQDELQKYEEQQKGKEELQDLLHSVTLKDGSKEFVNAAVKDEFRRMKKKINGVIRQCNRLKEGIPIETKPRKGFNRPAEMNASAAYSHSPPLSAVNKKIDPQEIQQQGHSKQTNPRMSRTPTRQHMVMEDRVMEDHDDHPALEQQDVLEEEEEEEEDEEAYAAPKPTVDRKVPGWFLQESPAEAWRRRKEAEKKKKASGASAGRHPGQPKASGPAPPGMAKAPQGFSVPFPEKDAGVPEFMRRFQQIGMKGREAVVESAGKIDTSSGDVKVTRGGIMYSGAAAAKRAEEERLAREEQEEKEMEEQAQKDYEARMRYEEEAQAARRRREEEEARRKEEEERRQREEEERRRREEEEEKRRQEGSKSQEEKDREEREKAEREAKEKAELEAKEKAEREAKEKVEREAKEKAEREAKEKAEREAKEKEEQAIKAPPKKKSSFLDSSSSDSDSSTFPPRRKAAPAGGKKKKSFFDDSSSDDSS